MYAIACGENEPHTLARTSYGFRNAPQKEWEWAKSHQATLGLKQQLGTMDNKLSTWARTFMTCEQKDVRAKWSDEENLVESEKFVKEYECLVATLASHTKKMLSLHRVEMDFVSG